MKTKELHQWKVARRRRHAAARGRPRRAAVVLAVWLLAVWTWTPERVAAADSNLPAALAELTQPAKRLPFKAIIEGTTGHRILDFDTNHPAHRELRAKILRAAALAGERARKEGLFAVRANEAGNRLEGLVKAALREIGLPARTPVTVGGGALAAGYPDLEISGPVPCYLELKTFSAQTANTTQRSFYFSPSAAPKVTRDALHLLLAYELEKTERDGRPAFAPVRWKLISLENLEVNLKFEFNQSNRGLYGLEAAKSLLGEDAVE